MPNFFETFVNAAVSQVGQDGGRVISNKIYGDGHAMPVRIAGFQTPLSPNWLF